MKRFTQGLALAAVLVAPGVVQADASAAVKRFRRDPRGSVAALKAAEASNPAIASMLSLLRAEALLANGEADTARVVALQAARAAPAFAPRANFLAARAALGGHAAGAPRADCKAALQFLEKAPVTPRWVPADERLQLVWQAEHACGLASAEATRRRLAVEWPESPHGVAATAGLELAPEALMRRALAFESARNYPAAEREYTSLLTGPSADEARFRLGKLHLERLRDDFRIAERAFAEVAAGRSEFAVEAEYLRARALGRAGDAPGAAAAYERFLTQHPTASQAPDARFFRAFLDYEGLRYEAAAKAFADITDGPWAGASRWYAAFSLSLAGAATAGAALDALADAEPDPAAARRARYWAARAREATAPDEARRRLLTLAREDPLDWYGLLVRRRFPGALSPIAGLPVSKRGLPTAPVPPRQFVAITAQVRQLAAAGLHDFARLALAAAWPAFRKGDHWALQADLARTAEDFGRLYRGAHARFRSVLSAPPLAGNAALWRAAYPMGYAETLGRAATDGLRATHLAAFIVKESAFDPDAVSPAHAVGLMQLMGYTARGILAARGAVPGGPAGAGEDQPLPDLFHPAENVALGGWYLGALSRRFGGQLPLIAAAYNGGPQSVLGWFRGRKSAETDLFVENIPYRETRDYVKQLVELHVIFQLVHEGRTLDAALASLPAALDLTVRDGVAF